jgi:hypothetical protein
MNDPNQLADRYVAMWNEPDAERRRALVAELWAEDGAHILEPPEEMRAIAARPGIGLASRLEARGHDELVARITSAYEEWVARGGFRFRRGDDAARVADAVTFRWEMLAPDGEAAASGLDFVVVRPDGRILRDYQFVGR